MRQIVRGVPCSIGHNIDRPGEDDGLEIQVHFRIVRFYPGESRMVTPVSESPPDGPELELEFVGAEHDCGANEQPAALTQAELDAIEVWWEGPEGQSAAQEAAMETLTRLDPGDDDDRAYQMQKDHRAMGWAA